MPSLIGHVTVPLALRIARRLPPRLLAAGLVACMLPDADTLGVPFGIGGDGPLAHRGWTHSLVFALAVALLATAFAERLGAGRRRVFAVVLACASSHPLLDLLTDGGPGIMLGWPFSMARMFAPVRPVAVSPLGTGFFSARGVDVVASEALWIVMPAVAIALAFRALRRARHIR